MEKNINGKEIAANFKSKFKEDVQKIKKRFGYAPKIAVILVGDDPASQVYVRNKKRAMAFVEIGCDVYTYPSDTTQIEIERLINRLNEDHSVHGILVQLPLPKQLDKDKIINKINPEKDVDGLTLVNFGKLGHNYPNAIIPCTPYGVVRLLKEAKVEISGKHAVIVGRSNLVGKPLSLLLLNENATVTVCHSKTKDLGEHTRQADILVSAVGVPKIIKKEMVKEGAVIVDVGINRLEEGLVGDVDYDDVYEKVSLITPVPGGVGPMTIAMLIENLLLCFRLQEGDYLD